MELSAPRSIFCVHRGSIFAPPNAFAVLTRITNRNTDHTLRRRAQELSTSITHCSDRDAGVKCYYM